MTTISPLTQDARAATVAEHYRRLADRYDEFLCYSPEFVRTLTAKMVRMLDLRESDRLVDLGCGTAMYAIDILQQVPLTEPVTGVDPFPEMLARIPPGQPVTPVAESAMVFSARPESWDKILMKEAVHHEDDRATLFANLFARLTPGGRLLLVHVPPSVQYPLFEEALRRAEQWHANPDELVALLEQAGFQVEREGLDVPHRIPKETYFRMVAAQYMSVLSSFTLEEIAEGLQEMERTYGDRRVLEFTDHFDYIVGIKPLEGAGRE